MWLDAEGRSKYKPQGTIFPLKTSVLPVIFVELVYILAPSKIQLTSYELQKFHFDRPSSSFFFFLFFPFSFSFSLSSFPPLSPPFPRFLVF